MLRFRCSRAGMRMFVVCPATIVEAPERTSLCRAALKQFECCQAGVFDFGMMQPLTVCYQGTSAGRTHSRAIYQLPPTVGLHQIVGCHASIDSVLKL